MKEKNYVAPELLILRVTEDCLTTSGEGVATDVEWIGKGELFS